MNADLLIIPHTHWDREWYATFENSRFHLVQLMDELIEVLEQDESIPGFLLDGQTILIDDYLEMRPEMESRFEAIASRGRITLGPWYVQPDEWLVSGEALVRNLQIGIASARTYGQPMLEGYVPDTFGHIAQLPQILQGFGIPTFYAMRGLGEELARVGTEFFWEAPDGSKVLTHYLAESYSNGGTIGPTPEESFVHHGKTVSYDSLHELKERMESRTTAPVVLVLNGSDHTAMQDDLSATVRSLSQRMPVRLGLLGDYHREVDAAHMSLKTVSGEWRYGRYFPILKGVFSARGYLKQLNTKAEQRLEVDAERFSLLLSAVGLSSRHSFLTYAWKKLIENHAHDSICGCSIDEVHDEVMTRLRKSLEVSDAVVSEALERLAVLAAGRSTVHEDGTIPIVVFNTSPWKRSGSTSVVVHPLSRSPLGVREFGFSDPRRDFTLDGYVLEDDRGRSIQFSIAGSRVTVEDMLLRRKVLLADTVSFRAQAVPAMGYRVFTLRPGHSGSGNAVQNDRAPGDEAKSVASDGSATIDNGNIRATVHRDGTIALFDYESGREYTGLNEFIDEGDAGDEYTFSPPRSQASFSSADLDWTVGREGNVIAASAEFGLPGSVTDDRAARSTEIVQCRIEMSVSVEAGSRLVRIRAAFENRCRDHRLRAVFPIATPCTESVAESAFCLVRRPTIPDGSPDDREQASNTHAQRRFVFVESNGHGFVLFNKGLPEYEVTPAGELSLTLLRAVGWLSRSDLVTRPGQVGPELPTPGAQCQGAQMFEYGFAAFDGPASEQSLFRMAEEYLHPLWAKAVQTSLPVDGILDFDSLMEVDNDRVVVSALRPEGEGALLRVFNPHGEQQSFCAKWGRALAGVEETTLAEGPGEPVSLLDEYRFQAGVNPHAIATYRVRFVPRRLPCVTVGPR